jgi:uncharacterized protein
VYQSSAEKLGRDVVSLVTQALPPSERIVTLDIVRGAALLGILIMNMPGFGESFFAGADGSHAFNDPVNRTAESLRDMLFSGKFNSMFSLLFGIGFTIQLGRMQRRQPQRALWLYGRRLIALMVLGLLHVLLLWGGDVLHVYAVLGIGLLLLRNASDRLIVGVIVACPAFPALTRLAQLLWVSQQAMDGQLAQFKVWEALDNRTFGHGSYASTVSLHAREFAFSYANPLSLWGMVSFYVQMATTMLMGFLVGRHGWVRRIGELMPQIRRLQFGALPSDFCAR